MPKIKKFKELSHRQQNRRLLLNAKEDNIFVPKSNDDRQDYSYIGGSPENQNLKSNYSTMQLFPEIDTQNIQDNIESNDNIENSNLLYNDKNERKGTLQEQLHI